MLYHLLILKCMFVRTNIGGGVGREVTELPPFCSLLTDTLKTHLKMKIFCVLFQFVRNIGAAESRVLHGFVMKQHVKIILPSHLTVIRLS